MTPEELHELLRRGLGRAVIRLRSCPDATPYRETILHACAHPLSYDFQLEGGRELLLYDVIQATGEPEYYLPRLTELLLTAQEYRAKAQLFGLAALFAQSGSQPLRQAMYRRFAEDMALQPNESEIAGGHTFIELDGLSGYLFMADLFRQYIPDIENYYEHGLECISKVWST